MKGFDRLGVETGLCGVVALGFGSAMMLKNDPIRYEIGIVLVTFGLVALTIFATIAVGDSLVRWFLLGRNRRSLR